MRPCNPTFALLVYLDSRGLSADGKTGGKSSCQNARMVSGVPASDVDDCDLLGRRPRVSVCRSVPPPPDWRFMPPPPHAVPHRPLVRMPTRRG